MYKGLILLASALILSLAMLYLISTGPATQFDNRTAPSLISSELPMDCGYDNDCLIQAVSECAPATFLLPHPQDESVILEGELVGHALGKCQIILEDKSGKSMVCYLDKTLPAEASMESLREMCSGELLDELLSIKA
jgi:hypothetical protein